MQRPFGHDVDRTAQSANRSPRSDLQPEPAGARSVDETNPLFEHLEHAPEVAAALQDQPVAATTL